MKIEYVPLLLLLAYASLFLVRGEKFSINLTNTHSQNEVKYDFSLGEKGDIRSKQSSLDWEREKI